MNEAIPVQLDGAGKVYPGDVVAVRDLSLVVRAGQTIALLGPNGAGKTTTIRMILGLAKPTQGTVGVFGRDPRDSTARMRIGAMLQIAEMPATLTVREHIIQFSAYYPRPLAVAQTLRMAALEDVANRRSERLSGGQRQRLAFALAICGDPDLLVLDEPTANLDIESRVGLWDAIRTFASRGKTIIFTTHYLAEADAFAERIALISRGALVADGSPADIKASAGVSELEGAYLALTKSFAREAVFHGQHREPAIVIITCPELQKEMVGVCLLSRVLQLVSLLTMFVVHAQMLGIALQRHCGGTGVLHLALHGIPTGLVERWEQTLLSVAEPGVTSAAALAWDITLPYESFK